MVKDYEVTSTLRNNQLKSRRLKRGLTQVELAILCGVSMPQINRLENLRDYPQLEDGTWAVLAIRLAKFFHVPEEELFPDSMRQVVKTKLVVCADAKDIQHSLESAEPLLLESEVIEELDKKITFDQILKHMDKLPPRYKQILVMRFGLLGEREHSLDEIGERLNIGKERVRQLEIKALYILRHPGMPWNQAEREDLTRVRSKLVRRKRLHGNGK